MYNCIQHSYVIYIGGKKKEVFSIIVFIMCCCIVICEVQNLNTRGLFIRSMISLGHKKCSDRFVHKSQMQNNSSSRENLERGNTLFALKITDNLKLKQKQVEVNYSKMFFF